MEDKRLDNLGKQLFNYFMKSDPILATYIGVHEYDGLMPNGNPKRHLEDIKKAKIFLSKFKNIKSSKLSYAKRIDKEVAIHILKLFVFEEDKLRFWEKNPDEMIGNVGDALFMLLARDFAPIKTRLESILSRMENIPRFIEETKGCFKKPVKLWTELAIENCEQFPKLLDAIRSVGRRRLKGALLERLNKASAKAEQAVVEFRDWLKEEILPSATEKFAIGEKKFEQLLKFRELGLNPEEILLIGGRLLAREKRKLKRIANEINPDLTVDEIKEIIKSKHPKDFEEVIRAVKKAVLDAKKFVIEKEFATMPKNESLKVSKTPDYMQHTTPFAAYFGPTKFDKIKIGIYVVTTDEKNIERLKEHSFASIINTSIHEGYPGHHLQLSCAAANPSLIRTLSDATEFVEGWAHYCEEEMANLGYINLETQFIQTVDAIWRAARIIIDIKLSRGRMSINEGVNFLVENTGMERSAALSEVRRYTQNPAYPLSYLLGKEMIKNLKKEVREKLRTDFNEKDFHDILLYSGSLPIKYIRKVLSYRKLSRVRSNW